MNAKIIKIAIYAVILSCGGNAVQGSDDSAAAGMMLDSITTISGVRYEKIELLTADSYGLLFRHAKGIAKVDFKNLSQSLREMFEPEPVAPVAKTEVKAGAGAIDRIEIYTRTRVTVRPQTNWWPQQNPCCASQINWLPHWSRYHSAHANSYFHCRQMVEYDFLISSGILPAPRGVTVRRLPRRGY